MPSIINTVVKISGTVQSTYSTHQKYAVPCGRRCILMPKEKWRSLGFKNLDISMQHEIHVTKKPNGEQTTKGDALVASGLSKRAVIGYILLHNPAQFFVPTNGDCYTFIMAPLRNYAETPLFRLFV